MEFAKRVWKYGEGSALLKDLISNGFFLLSHIIKISSFSNKTRQFLGFIFSIRNNYNFFYLNLHSNWPKRLFQFKMFFSIFLIFTLIFSKNAAAQLSKENFGISAEYMEGLTEGKLHLENRQIGLHYVTGGNPDAPNLLIFVHGFPQFWYAWRHQLQYFSKMEQYQVYAFDLRGFGKSDRPSGVLNYTMDEHVEDIAEAIQMLKAKWENGNKLTTLVTHDIGAAIGSMLNYKYPKLVDAFVMMNAPNPRTIKGMLKEGKLNIPKMIKTPYFYKILAFQFPLVGEKVVKGNNFEFFDKLFLTDDGAILNQGNGGTFNETDLEVYKKAYSQKGAVTSALNFFRAPLRKAVHDIGQAILAIFSNPEDDENSGKLADKIEAKCLVIWGESDAAFGLEFGEAAANACKNGQIVPVNSSHWVPEDVPQKVNKLIEKFVAEF